MKTLALTIMAVCVGAGSASAQMATPTPTTGIRVTGVVELQSKKELRTAAVTMTQTDAEGNPIGPLLAARMYPDGAFFFVNVEPGKYLLRASGQPFDDTKSMFATQDVPIAAAATSIGNLYILLNQPNPPVKTTASKKAKDAESAGFAAADVPPLPPEFAISTPEAPPE